MNELERTALNEILRTVTYIAEKLDERCRFRKGKWRKIMIFILTISTNMLITFIFLNLYSRYLAKELKKIEDRVLVYIQLKTILQKDSPSSVKE